MIQAKSTLLSWILTCLYGDEPHTGNTCIVHSTLSTSSHEFPQKLINICGMKITYNISAYPHTSCYIDIWQGAPFQFMVLHTCCPIVAYCSVQFYCYFGPINTISCAGWWVTFRCNGRGWHHPHRYYVKPVWRNISFNLLANPPVFLCRQEVPHRLNG